MYTLRFRQVHKEIDINVPVYLSAGLDPEIKENRLKLARRVLENYYKKTTQAARSLNPHMLIFHNSGNILRGRRDLLQYFSHLELESLPTGGWGYDHFPISAKYVSQLDLDYLGHDGKVSYHLGRIRRL